MILRRAFRVLLVAAVLLAPTLAAGQIAGTVTGSIVGTVRDVTGAILPAVEIAIVGDPLMESRRTSTNAGGEYRIAALPPGSYTLSFSLDDTRAASPRRSRVHCDG